MATENLNDASKLYRATVMLSSGEPQQPVDVLFFHNRSYGDYTGLFEIARKMFEEGRVRFIAVTNNEGERVGSTIPFEANPGKTWCIENLMAQQIPAGNILYPYTMAFQTREENNAFLELSRQMEWKEGVILTQPHQIVRPMLGMVQAMHNNGYQMKVYTAIPRFTPWQEVVRGNQGTEFKPRFDHIEDERKRISDYQASGELATFDQLLDYLKARDDGSLILGPVERGSEKLTRDLPLDYQPGLT